LAGMRWDWMAAYILLQWNCRGRGRGGGSRYLYNGWHCEQVKKVIH
jgi:predicted transcriptional regulator